MYIKLNIICHLSYLRTYNHSTGKLHRKGDWDQNDQSGGKLAFFTSIDSHSTEFNLKWRRKLAFLASIYEIGDQKSNKAEARKIFCPKERKQWGELVQNEKTFRLLIEQLLTHQQIKETNHPN